MNKKSRVKKIGGMSLLNGILLRSNERECITEYIDEKISINIININEDKNILSKIPIIRGIYGIQKNLFSGVSYLMSSVKETCKDIFKNEDVDEIKVSKFEVYFGYFISILILLFLIIIFPNYASTFTSDVMKMNIVQALIQLILFVVYIVILKSNKLLQTIFEYHGAEHKVVNAYEKLDINEITLESVKKESRFHRRCGGNFVVYFYMLIILSTLFIASTNICFKSLLQIILIPIFIGVSYEILEITSNLNGILSYISYPAMLIQFITTKEPSDDKIQIAIYTLFGCVKENNSIKLKEYINRYVKDNLKLKEYELNDILRLVSKVKKVSKEEVFLNLNTLDITYQEQISLDVLLNKLYKENIPLQYLLGKQSFYKEEYEINENVLIPRADTEILVEKAIEYINKENFEKIIDMCTGSGCVGISIAKNSNIKFGFLVDISLKALEVANKNNILNGTSNKLGILKSNLFDEFKNLQESKYDIIVSNPPYIKTSVINTLSKQVQKEPLIALDGGKDGLQIYKKIFVQAKDVLRDGGYLMLEIGYDQLEQITKIINKDINYELVESVKDLSGNDRVVICRFLQK